MHIADATLFFAPHSGGVKRYLLAKRRHLRALGVRHSLLVPGARSAVASRGIVTIAAPRIPFGGGYRVPLRPALWRDTLVRLRADLIEVADPYHLAWSALAAARTLGVPAVAFAHSDVARLFATRFGRLAGAAAAAYLRRLYERFDLVLAPSRSVAQRLQASGVERVEVQALGVDAETFHPAARAPGLRTQLGLPPTTRLLAFAGRMAREKSIGLMCAAVEGLGAPYHLVLVGAPERRRLSGHVTLWPYEHDARRLARLLASADALLHAGEQETFGLVVLEAMACGRPVVAVAGGAIGELVDGTVGRLAARGDAASLQEAIAALYEADPDALGAAARARVEHAYAWPAIFRAQLARYARLAHARRDADGRFAAEGAPP